MALAPRVTGVLENNVSIERLTESKRLAAVLVDVAGRQTALALGRPADQGAALATALFALMIGVTQTMEPPPDSVQLALPPDVRMQLEGESPEDAFVRIGSWLVAGSR